MSRPSVLVKDKTLYWTIRLYNDSQVLVDADSTPTVAVRKNGTSVVDSVSVSKRAATTGIYDCEYNPSGELEGDQFTLEESATVSSTAYENSWQVAVQDVERGTDGANTVAPDNAGISANGVGIGNIDTVVDLIKADTTAILFDTGFNIPAQITALNDPTAAEIADAVWDESLSAHIGAGSAGIYLLDSGLVSAKLETALEADGAGGWQYTTLALENAPSGGGGGATDWTPTERSQIRHRLGVDGATATPSATPDLAREDTLDAVGAIVADTNVRVQTVAVDTYAEFTSGNNEDAFKADVSALATSTEVQSVFLVTSDTNTAVNALNDFDPASDVVARVTLVDTTTDLTNQNATGPTAQEIVDTWGNQPQGVYTTPDTLGFYLDAQVSTAGSGGEGLYQATVRVQDSSGDALQGARVNVDGTTLTLTTGSSGEVTFNLDSGVYLLEVSPPAGYDTPIGQTVTITSSDPPTTVFTLNSTQPPTNCDVPWIG
jgi:hypothetical protein